MHLSLFLLLLFSNSTAPISPTNAEELPVADNSIFLSTDQGATWDCFGYGLPEEVTAREVTEHNGDLYLTTNAHGLYRLPAGTTYWQAANNGLPKELSTISLAGSGDYLVLGTYRYGIYVSKDGGAHWRKPLFNLQDYTISTLLFHDGVVLAGTDGGIFESYDYGENWRQAGSVNYGIRVLTLHKGKIIVAKQNGLGTFTGKDVTWSDTKTEWAVGQLISEGDFVYAVCAKGEVFRSKDGEQWEAAKFYQRDFSAKQLGEKLWSGYKAELPNSAPAGPIRTTSHGWVTSVFSGC